MGGVCRHRGRRPRPSPGGQVDKPSKSFPEADELDEAEKLHGRSITLSSNRLGLIAKLDLIEAEDGMVTPIDYKRGKRPHVARGAYDPERVRVTFDEELKQLTDYSRHSPASRRGLIEALLGVLRLHG